MTDNKEAAKNVNVASSDKVAAPDPIPAKRFRLKKLFKKPTPKSILYLLALVVVVGIAYFFLTGGFNRNTVDIGGNKVSKQAIQDYVQQLTKYKQAHPNVSFGSNLNQYAGDKLILNAALKFEAKKRNIQVSNLDLIKADSLSFPTEAVAKAYVDNLRRTNNMVQLVNMENVAYQAKLQTKLIRDEKLTMVTMILDTPYFNNLPKDKVQAAYNQAEARMKNTFLPLVAAGKSEQAISQKADISYNTPATSAAADNAAVNHELNLYFTQGVVAVSQISGYQKGITGFNDNDSTSWIKGNLGKVSVTADKVNQLKKAGDNTGVFASKAGALMIIRLDSVTGGTYSSWTDFLQHYKDKYAAGKLQLAVAGAGNMVTGLANSIVAVVATPGLDQAWADSGDCSSHFYKLTVIGWDAQVGAVISGVKLVQNRSSSGSYTDTNSSNQTETVTGGTQCDQGGSSKTITSDDSQTTDGYIIQDSTNTLTDDCFNLPPTFSVPVTPSGYTPYINSTNTNAKFEEDPASYKSGTTPVNVTNWSSNALLSGFPDPPNYDSTDHIRPGQANFNTYTVVLEYTPVNQCTTCNCVGQPACPVNPGSGDVTCNSAYETIASGTLAGNQQLHIYVTDSGGHSLATGYIHSSETKWNPGNFIPLGQTVTKHVVLETHNGDGTWSYATYGSDETTGNCYAATCVINGVTGTLPGGYIRAGGSVTGSITIYNVSPSGLGLPGNDGSGHNLSAQSAAVAGSVNGAFTNVTNAGQPIAYPYSGDTSVTENFTTTVSSSGGIIAGVEYIGSSGFTLGTQCGIGVTVYPPPVLDIDGVACNGSISGWAYAPLVSDESIPVEVWVDGPRGTDPGHGTELPGTPAAAAGSRPDVDAAFGITGDHGYSFSIPAAYQNGQNHTFYVYADDPLGVEDTGPQTVGMTGCESFHLQPGANGGALSPISENPTSFDGTATINVTYYNGATGVTSSTYNYSTFPGVPPAATCLPTNTSCPSYTFTKNGTVVGSGSVPAPNPPGNGRFNDTSYKPPAVAIASASFVAGDTYCLNVGASPIDGFIQNDGTVLSVSNSGPDTQKSCDTVKNRSFFKVYNGGVSAGGSFSALSGGSCGGGGTLGGWNNNTGTYPTVTSGDYGASAQLNALALSNIVGVGSAQPPFGNSPTALSFANDSTNITGDNYSPKLGGAFDPTGNGYCFTDPPATVPSVAGPYTQPGTTVNKGTYDQVYVTGNVYISGNIIYASASDGTWSLSGANNVPRFVLHATGNIYIDPSVTELDGLYISQGKIYTCSDSTGFKPMAATDMYANCNKQLTVYGNFVATQVNMMRTFGSLRDETPVITGFIPPTPPSFTSAAGFCFTENNVTKPCSAGMTCTTINEPADTLWDDNSLCVPAGSTTSLQWSWAGSPSVPSGWQCNKWNGVGSTGYPWNDNYLCSNNTRLYFNPTDQTTNTPTTQIQCVQLYDLSDSTYTGGSSGGDWLCENLETSSGGPGNPGSATAPTSVDLHALNGHTGCSNNGGGWLSQQTCAAEVFYNSPELYLSTPPTGSNFSGKWDAATSLPPVL